MRVLVFGSSSAEGFWDTQGGWVARLRRHYDNQKIENPSLDTPWVTNLGVSGDTVNDILERFDSETEMRLKEGRECVFIFHVGSNNAAEWKGKIRTEPQVYQEELERLINKAKSYSQKIIVVGFHAVDESKTRPIGWADLYYENSNILEFENAAHELCDRLSVPFVPVHQESLEEAKKGAKLQAHDGLHPNDAGHQLIFELVRPALDRLLDT